MDLQNIKNKTLDTIVNKLNDRWEEKKFTCKIHGNVLCQVLKSKSHNLYCPICEQIKESEKMAMLKANEHKKKCISLGIREKHFSASFDMFIPPTLKAENFLKKLQVLLQSNKNHIALLYGKSGTGKTMLCSASVIEKGGLYTTYEWIAMRIRASYSNGTQETELSIIEEMCNKHFLVIDEIDKGVDSEAKKSLLSLICRERYERNKPLWLAGNCNTEWINATFDTSVIDRLKNEGTSFLFDWDSYRKREMEQ